MAPVFTTLRNGLGQTVGIAAIHAADMNNDGQTDVVVGGFRAVPIGPRGGVSRTDYLHVLLPAADGSGSFAQAYTHQISRSSIHVADFDGDGRQDLLTVAAVKSKTTSSNLWLGDGDGTLTLEAEVTQFVAVEVTVGDFNGDGKADVIRENANGKSTVFLGQGDGRFNRTDTIDVTGELSVADINGDGRIDLVSANTAAGTVWLLLGKGNGKFKPAQDFAAGPSPTDLALAEIDGDGWLDLVLKTSDGLSVLLNDQDW
jgi:hypothetical protein